MSVFQNTLKHAQTSLLEGDGGELVRCALLVLAQFEARDHVHKHLVFGPVVWCSLQGCTTLDRDQAFQTNTSHSKNEGPERIWAYRRFFRRLLPVLRGAISLITDRRSTINFEAREVLASSCGKGETERNGGDRWVSSPPQN